MKLTPKFLSLALTAFVGVALVSCSNELGDTYSQIQGLRLAKNPDITAWTGNHYLTGDILTPSVSLATREGVDLEDLLWDFTEHDHSDWEILLNIVTESEIKELGGIDITKFEDKDFNKDGTIYYIPFKHNGELNFEWKLEFSHAVKIYNFGEITEIKQINYKDGTEFYNAGIIHNLIIGTGQNHIIYNVNTLHLTHYSTIDKIYNNGVLYLEKAKNEYYEDPNGKADVPDSNKIYSLTDIYMPDGGDFKAEADIHGIIISKKDLKIQNDHTQYVCGVKVNGHLDLTNGKLQTSYLEADELSFDGAHIWLLPEAFIKAKLISSPNSSSEVYCARNSMGYFDIINVNFGNLNNFEDTFGSGIYFDVTGTIDVNEYVTNPDGGIGKKQNHYENLDSYLESENGIKIAYRFNPPTSGESECGGIWNSSNADDPCPETHGKCKHPGSSHNNGYCDECVNENDPCHDPNSTQTEDPCPNIKEGEISSGCPHDGENHNNDENHTCPKCIEEGLSSDCNPNEPCPNHKCPHDATHHEDGGCDLCEENEGCNVNENNPGEKECPNKDKPEFEGGCDHSHKGTYCPDCSSEGGKCKYPDNIKGGVTKSEVEVNLSINDEHEKYVSDDISDLVAKLSIHVRLDGDVEILIPIPKENYIAADDLVILNTHEPGEFIHGGPLKVTYNVGGTDVTLTLKYEEEGIRVTTDGINEDVFNYCRAEYGDGINFEVWLYTNNESELTFDNFKELLNQSTIEFLDKNPDYYINAFKDTVDNPQGKKDCIVTIIDEQKRSYSENPIVSNHLNASEFNKIYKYKDCQGPEGEHDHDFLWKYGK